MGRTVEGSRRRAERPHRQVLRHDEQIGQRYVPNQRARVPFEDGGYLVTTNSLGFRSDREFVAERGPTKRVLFLGDSYTAGFGVDNDERFPELAGGQLGLEVYNAGITGSGTDQQVLAYEHYLSTIDCDLIVLAVMVENIERNKARVHLTIDPHTGDLQYTPKPYFELSADRRLTLAGIPVSRERESANHSSLYGQRPDGLLGLGRGRLKDLLADPRLRWLHRGLTQNVGQAIQRLAGHQPYRDYEDEGSDGWRLMAGIVDRLAEAVDGTPLLVLPIPTNHFLRRWPLEPVYQERFASLADPTRDVHVADVTSPLQATAPDLLAQLSFTTDAHFSRTGHRVVAQVVADAIAEVPGFERTAPDVPPAPAVATDRPHYVLGLSCFYHNSAAALLRDGELVAAAEEERFSRRKADRRFPASSVNYCLEEAGISPTDLTSVVYYDNPYLTFERLMHSQLAVGRAGAETWERVVPGWVEQKLRIPDVIRQNLGYDGEVHHDSHHRSHAASAFYPAPFERAAVLTIDGVGEWATATIGAGRGASLELLQEMRFPHSVGLLYSAFTQFVGFKVNNGEYKMMGLAPYGDPVHVEKILDNIVDLKDDGSVELNLDYFSFLEGQRMTSRRFDELFGGPPRGWDDPVTQREMDISASIQHVTDEIVLRMARHAFELTGERNLCLAGGVALNCVANGRLLRKGPFDQIWIQPAAGDSGGALGAALDYWHTHLQRPRSTRSDGRSIQRGSLWGPAYSDDEIQAYLDSNGLPYEKVGADRGDRVARHIEEGKVVGHFSGRTEFGPRALGSRSILADARNPETQTTLNLRIKYRESFRPFAPTVLAKKAGEYFDLDAESPYMLIVAPVLEARRLPFDRHPEMDAVEIVRQPRSDVPAITHIDYSARIQTLTRDEHPDYHDVIDAFRRRTGTALVANTSFNVRGEPIICTPYDAYRCFMRTEMDVLVLGNQILLKADQPPWHEAKGHVESGVSEPVGVTATPLVIDLRAIFSEDLVPLIDHLEGKGWRTSRIDTPTGDSAWIDSPDRRGRFEIAPALQHPGSSPRAVARAICAHWEPGPVTDGLLPIVERLVEAGTERPQRESAAEEAVSEHIYALY